MKYVNPLSGIVILKPPLRTRMSAALTQVGPGHDLRGFTVPSLVHPNDNGIIYGRWPRLGVAEHVTNTLEDEIRYKPRCLRTKWAPGRILGAMNNIDYYKRLEGKAQEDRERKQRRKTVTLRLTLPKSSKTSRITHWLCINIAWHPE